MASFFFTLGKLIVNINFHVRSTLFAEHLVHQPLVSSSYVFQSKWHDSIAVESFTIDESILIFLLHLHLVVTWKSIHKRQELVSYCWIDELVNPQQWEDILWAGIVQVSEIYAQCPFSIFLFYHDDVWPTSQGNRLLEWNWLQEICLLCPLWLFFI